MITAAVGAMVLAHRERFERRKTQRELSQERFRPGGHPTPLPNPGVYARHNAVDVAALLPRRFLFRIVGPRMLRTRGADGLQTPSPGAVSGSLEGGAS